MRYLSLLLFLWTCQVWANTWQESLHSLLPQSLQFIELNKTTLAQVEAKIGKAALVRDAKYYWVYQGYEYGLELKLKNKVVQSIHFTFPKDAPSVDVLKLDPKNFKESAISGSRFMDYHDVGGSISIDLTSQKISIIRIK